MAEVAGLVLGVVGVAGVIGAFKDAVDLFNLIVDSGNVGREFEILDTKLDIEKTLLLQWAEEVGLINAGLAPRGQQGEQVNYDTRLADETTQGMIIRSLNCIEGLLNNAPDLKKRYGMIEASESQVLTRREGVFGEARWSRFLDKYDRWGELCKVKSDEPIPHGKRIRWVIRDREKFERLVQEVGYFTSKIREILPVQGTGRQIQEDVEATRDFRKLKILLEAASAGFSNAIADSARLVIPERRKDRVLNRLWFRKIDDRRESITTAHRRTLEWSLQPKVEGAQWDNLSDWLRESSGIYWVVGKAGSGKSTLMKYLNTESRTKTLLNEWTKGEKLQLCNYFFFNLGTTEQKSQEGLSRTLLHQILSVHRDMIPEVLPGMWKEVHDNETANVEDIDLPSVAETRQAFEVLTRNAEKMGWFCFLIDGLDEFVGDYREGIALIRKLASNTRFKVIVSSRPIPACVAAFSTVPSLSLQDFNRADIELYVRDSLGSQAYMKRLLVRHPGEAREILDDIINKSSGVFLWVVLACRSLIDGFAAYDRIAELRRRVDELPPELEDMFQHMLSRIEGRHREQGARLLKTCYRFYAALWDNSDETMNLYALGMALVEDYSTNFRPPQTIPNAEKRELCLELQGRLRSRCGGLLEIASSSGACFCERKFREKHDILIDSRVVFMHRSVFEFLRDDKVWSLGALSLPEDDDYDDATALSLYNLHIAKQSLFTGRRTKRPDPQKLFENGLRWTSFADAQPRGDPGLFLNNMHLVLRYLTSADFGTALLGIQEILERTNRVAHLDEQAYISFIIAIYLGEVNYVERNFFVRHNTPHCPPGCSCPPILFFALEKRLLTSCYQPRSIPIDPKDLTRSQEMLATLLSSGCNPNERFSIGFTEGSSSDRDFYSTTPWTVFLSWARSTMNSVHRDTAAIADLKPIISQMINEFLRYGAEVKDLKFDLTTWRASVGLDEKKLMARNQNAAESQGMTSGEGATRDRGTAANHITTTVQNTTTHQRTMTDQRTAANHSITMTQSTTETIEVQPPNNTPVPFRLETEWVVVDTPQESSRTVLPGSVQMSPGGTVGPSLLSGRMILEGASNLKSATFSKTRQFRDWVKKHGR